MKLDDTSLVAPKAQRNKSEQLNGFLVTQDNPKASYFINLFFFANLSTPKQMPPGSEDLKYSADLPKTQQLTKHSMDL